MAWRRSHRNFQYWVFPMERAWRLEWTYSTKFVLRIRKNARHWFLLTHLHLDIGHQYFPSFALIWKKKIVVLTGYISTWSFPWIKTLRNRFLLTINTFYYISYNYSGKIFRPFSWGPGYSRTEPLLLWFEESRHFVFCGRKRFITRQPGSFLLVSYK